MVGTSLPRHAVRVALPLREEHLLDFVVDADEPCLGARGPIAKVRSLGLGFPQSFFGCAKLKRKFMSEIHGAFAVFVRQVRGFLQIGRLRMSCPDLSAAWRRSSARIHRPRRRYPFALLA